MKEKWSLCCGVNKSVKIFVGFVKIYIKMMTMITRINKMTNYLEGYALFLADKHLSWHVLYIKN